MTSSTERAVLAAMPFMAALASALNGRLPTIAEAEALIGAEASL